jgi:outer membrane biosynthesis protein TonB
MRSIINLFKTLYEHGYFTLLLLVLLIGSVWLLIHFLKKSTLSDSNKSIVITTHTVVCIVLLLLFVRFWPPYGKTEMLIAQGGGGGGVTLNYGDTDFGKGDDYLNETLEVNMKDVASETEESTPEDILTQDNTGADVPTPPKSKIKPKDKKPTETKPVETPKASVKKPNSALSNMIKGKNKGGDGNSTTNGNQGSANGNANSNGYYGGGSGGGTGGGNGTGNGTGSGAGNGSGSGGGNGSGGSGGANYSLSGRRAIIKPAVDNECNSFGKVVIEVTVDKAGNTIGVSNGRGTTGDACLIALAKNFARKTKWSQSDSATEKQVGTITYNFL